MAEQTSYRQPEGLKEELLCLADALNRAKLGNLMTGDSIEWANDYASSRGRLSARAFGIAELRVQTQYRGSQPGWTEIRSAYYKLDGGEINLTVSMGDDPEWHEDALTEDVLNSAAGLLAEIDRVDVVAWQGSGYDSQLLESAPIMRRVDRRRLGSSGRFTGYPILEQRDPANIDRIISTSPLNI